EKEALAKQAAAAETVPPALLHAPGAPRLGKRVPLPAVELPDEAEEVAEEAPSEPAEEAEPAPRAATPAPPPQPAAPAAPVVRSSVVPRLGPVRPIASAGSASTAAAS